MSGEADRYWLEALGDIGASIQVPDSARFTPQGRRLLASLGVVQPDPLRVEAERWLSEHTGCKTPATRRVRQALGDPVPADWVRSAQLARGAK